MEYYVFLTNKAGRGGVGGGGGVKYIIPTRMV